MCGFKKISSVSIPNIPKNRTKFPESNNDYWYELEVSNLDVSACIYEMEGNGVFAPHFHKEHTEHVIPITIGAKLEVITDTYERIIEFPHSIYFKPKEAHAVINLSDKPVVFIVLWSPKMNGWEGNFLNK